MELEAGTGRISLGKIVMRVDGRVVEHGIDCMMAVNSIGFRLFNGKKKAHDFMINSAVFENLSYFVHNITRTRRIFNARMKRIPNG